MKNNKSLVSVILPTYNSCRFLDRSISSVLNQTYKKIELIIVDDCSTDKSLEIFKKFLKKDKRVSLLKTERNSGMVAAPRNLGITKAKGQYIAFLDADDYWAHNKLSYQMSKIKNYDLSFTAANYQKDNSEKKSNFFINILRIIMQKFFTKMINKNGFFWLYVYNPFLISSVIAKKKIFKNTKFDPSLNVIEDLIFWLSIFKNKKYKFIFHPKILLTITRASNSMTSNKIASFNKVLISISNNFLENKNFEKFKYFLVGILLRTFKMALSRFFNVFAKYIKVSILIFLLGYFTIFYSPLFWHLGKKLIYQNTQKYTDAVIVLSGHQGFDYWNNSYKQRYLDIKKFQKKYNTFFKSKFFLIGKLQFIPDQKILESLLLNEGFNRENINIIYKEYKSSFDAIKLLIKEIEKNKIKSITIITSPYHSLRLYKIWSQLVGNKYDVVFFEHANLPKRNSFFERAINKKEIIYEILANLRFEILKK